MQVRFVDADPLKTKVPLLAIAVTEGTGEVAGLLARADRALGGAVTRVLRGGDMKGRAKDEVVLYASSEDGPARVLLLGVGKADTLDSEQIRRFAGRAVRAAERLG